VFGRFRVVAGRDQGEGRCELLCETGGVTESHVEVDVCEDRLTDFVESSPRRKDAGELCYHIGDVVCQVADDLLA
jgi:hypothetical protein